MYGVPAIFIIYDLTFFFFTLIEYIDKTSKRYRQARNWNHQARNKLHFEEAHSVSLVKI